MTVRIRQTILVIDDDPLIRELIQCILEDDYDVITVSGADDALKFMESLQPDLILLDVVMPSMDGYELFALIKQMPAMSDLPVLFLTCMSEYDSELRGLEMGAADYISKPFNPGLLKLRVRNHLLIKSNRDELRERYEIQRELDEELMALLRDLKESDRKYRQLFENMITGFALHEMIYGPGGEPTDYRFIEVNPVFEKLTGLRSVDIIGKTVREVMPDTEQYWIDFYGRVATTGEPASYQNFSAEIGRHFDVWAFSPEFGRFAVVFVDITERN